MDLLKVSGLVQQPAGRGKIWPELRIFWMTVQLSSDNCSEWNERANRREK